MSAELYNGICETAVSAVWWTLMNRWAVIKPRETFNQWKVLLFKSYIVHLCKLRLISTQSNLWQINLLKKKIRINKILKKLIGHTTFDLKRKIYVKHLLLSFISWYVNLLSLQCTIRWCIAFYFLHFAFFPAIWGSIFVSQSTNWELLN